MAKQDVLLVLASAGRLVGMPKYPQNASCSTARYAPAKDEELYSRSHCTKQRANLKEHNSAEECPFAIKDLRDVGSAGQNDSAECGASLTVSA